jgi:hypothetical protein
VPIAAVHIGNSIQQALDRFFGYLPNILGFLVILVVGFIVARVVKKILDKALEKAKIDETLQNSKAGGFVDKVSPGGRPSRLVGGLVFWLIMLFVLTAAIGALKIPSVTTFMNQVLAYLPNVIAAVIIFVIAAAVSGAVAAVAAKTMGDTPTGKLAATVIPGVIMAVAVFMILTQLKIAPTIVMITYAAVLGMLALAGALAFGLGGREVAGQMWSTAYQKSQEAQAQAKADLQKGKDRAQGQVSAATSGDSEGFPPAPGATRAGSPPPYNEQ